MQLGNYVVQYKVIAFFYGNYSGSVGAYGNVLDGILKVEELKKTKQPNESYTIVVEYLEEK